MMKKKIKNTSMFRLPQRLCFLLLLPLLTGLLSACEDSFLEEKPDKALVVPRTLEDMKALAFNDINIMNQEPGMGEMASDDVYTTADGLEGARVLERNVYLWDDDPYEGGTAFDWNKLYEQVFYTNVVLEGLEKIAVNSTNRQEWESVKGSAFFYRAYAFFNLAKIFTLPYGMEGEAALGIPLRLEADVDKVSTRASLQETYAQILEDLQAAGKLLPALASIKTQPGKATVYGMMSRVYLAMQDYPKAGAYADSALQLHNALLDYNAVDSSRRSPFMQLNEEVLFQSTVITYSFLLSGLTFVDPELYASYEENDLRRGLFFTEKGEGLANFRGSYNGNIVAFSGIATDELYLTRAECRAREGDLADAMAVLNTLMETRWRTGTFVPYTASNAGEALELILKERRKQLVYRGLRWADLRRLNREADFAKTLEREVGEETYTLAPDDPRYAFPIPDAEIELSGLAQNPR